MDYTRISGLMRSKGDLIGDGLIIRNICNSHFIAVYWLQNRILSVVLWLRNPFDLMASSSNSTASSDLALSFAIKLREIRRKLRRKKRHLQCMDVEEGRHLEIVDRDLSQLREEFAESIS